MMDAPGGGEGDQPADPEDLLPDSSVLSLDEYLEMQRVLGNRARFEIVYSLRQHGDLRVEELAEGLGESASALHYHLTRLQDSGLVEKRLRTTQDCTEPYYRATILADVLLEEGFVELIAREWDFHEAYGGDPESET